MEVKSFGSLRKAVVASAVAGATLVAGGASASAEPSAVLTEGVGSSTLQLGMTRQEVLNAYPNSFCASGAQCFVPGAGGFVGISFTNNEVELLEYENAGSFSGWVTNAGVVPSSSLEDIAAIYGVSVDGDTVDVPALGYSVREINDYNCNSSGCQISGSHLRHSITEAGDGGGTTTFNEVEGVIEIDNNRRRALNTQLVLKVKDSSGALVATETISVRIPAGGSWVVDPSTVIDLGSASVGEYSWRAIKQNKRRNVVIDRGTFSVVEVER